MHKSIWQLVLVDFCVFVLSIATATISTAEELDLGNLETRILSVVDKTMPAVVAISDRGMVFSGVIVSKEGLIISAGHAVQPDASYRILLSDGRRVRAKGLGVNRRVDMAMLQITGPGDWPFAEMGNSSALVRNQPCVSISHPGMFDSDRGAVVRFGRVIKPVTGNEGMIQTTAKMEPGDSGGPLFDLDAKIIGIHSNIRRSASENYDVPIDSFREYWDQLNKPERFEINGWPSLPKLGFRGEGTEDGLGVVVLKVYEGGLAEKSGLQPKDIVLKMAGKRVTSANHVYGRMIELKSAGINQFDLTVLRDGKQSTRRFRLTNDSLPQPDAFPQLKNLPAEVMPLESRLDDNVFVVRSSIQDKPTTVWATRIQTTGRGNLVSKSSRVGSNPRVELANASFVAAEIVSRDAANDLVLLEAKIPGSGGIDLNGLPGDLQERRGKLLVSPDPHGAGEVSVWGSKYFDVPRTSASGGFLGVVLGDQSGKVLIERVEDGAARRAGIESGDVLIRLNEIDIERRTDATRFLSAQDPNSKIQVVIERDDAELTKEVVLGNRPDESGHVADDVIGGKSFRRDGFQLAISHDAELRPEQCGGPLYDLQGEFLGVNISRFSRTRSYAIPKTVLKKFVDAAGK
jgi:S1-C subfamily serine protease